MLYNLVENKQLSDKLYNIYLRFNSFHAFRPGQAVSPIPCPGKGCPAQIYAGDILVLVLFLENL
jgi:hypothetical protein